MAHIIGATTPEAKRDVAAVEAYLEASMAQDPERASRYIAEGFRVTFTGGRVFTDASGPTSFNKARYGWVKKRIERYEVVTGANETIVYSLGFLYGEWPDGTPFDHNRYIDRFTVREGKILDTDVWNDSAEWILDPTCARHGADLPA